MSENNKTEVFDVEKIKQLVELMKANDISELALENGQNRIKLERKNNTVVAAPEPIVVAAPVSVQQSEEKVLPAESASIKTINSSLVGTFYTASKPGTKPYVKVGDYVSPDTTVCIIEAMKVFNQIQAEISGKIIAILVKNGDMVEFGTPLFKVDTQG